MNTLSYAYLVGDVCCMFLDQLLQRINNLLLIFQKNSRSFYHLITVRNAIFELKYVQNFVLIDRSRFLRCISLKTHLSFGTNLFHLTRRPYKWLSWFKFYIFVLTYCFFLHKSFQIKFYWYRKEALITNKAIWRMMIIEQKC